MNENPHKVGKEATHSEMAGLEDGKVLADHRHGAFVSISKAVLWYAAPDPTGDQTSHVAPLLDGRLRNAGDRSSVLLYRRCVAGYE